MIAMADDETPDGVELVKDDLWDDFDPESTEPIDALDLEDEAFDDPDGEPIGDLPE
jgi:hypothetical protein